MCIESIIAMNRLVRAPKGQVFEFNLEEFVNVTQSDEVASLITKIRQTEDKDERRRLKGQLPFRCPHYFRFADNHRSQDCILPEEFTFRLVWTSMMRSRWRQPSLARTFLIIKRAVSGRECCCTQSIRLRRNCIWTFASQWA